MNTLEAHSALPTDHPEYGAQTFRTLGIAIGAIAGLTCLAMNVATAEETRTVPARVPAYEVPYNPVIEGQLPPMPYPSQPGPDDLRWMRGVQPAFPR